MAACNPNELGFDVIFAWEDGKDDQNQNAQIDGAINRDDITCVICLLVLREPVQAVDCGHRFCTKCIGEFHLINPGKCPKDWQDIQVFPDVGKKREILSLKIRCKNFTVGCTWQNELREQKGHLEKCGYESVACQLECGEFVLRKNMQNHVDTLCPIVFPCEYQEFGCTFKGTKMLLNDHMANNMGTHMSFEMKYQIQKVKDEFNKQLTAKNQEMVRVKNEMKQLGKDLEKIKTTNEELVEDLKAKGKQIGVLTERLKTIEELKEEVEHNEKKIEDVKKEIDQTLEKNNKDLALEINDQLQEKCNANILMHQKIQNNLKELQAKLAQQNKL
uniref:Uncharacterized protein n=2 Tax=Clytia hemisphaerica TaxID=252671 RepID=A0A7M5WRL9_9CNID